MHLIRIIFVFQELITLILELFTNVSPFNRHRPTFSNNKKFEPNVDSKLIMNTLVKKKTPEILEFGKFGFMK